MQLTLSVCVLLATYYRNEVRRHFDDLLTSSSRPSPLSPPDHDVIDLRRRRDVTVTRNFQPGNPDADLDRHDNGIVRLYNHRRQQYVAVATPPYDVTITSRFRNDVSASARPRRHSRRLQSVHFSNQIRCTECE